MSSVLIKKKNFIKCCITFALKIYPLIPALKKEDDMKYTLYTLDN